MRRTIVLLAALAGLFPPSSVVACSCFGPMPCVSLGNIVNANTVVFTGVAESNGRGSTTFRVTEALNGAVGPTTVVNNGPGGCSAGFQAGVAYLVFASANGEVLSTSSCAGSAPVEGSASRIEQLRAARDRKRLPDLIGMVYGAKLDRAVTQQTATSAQTLTKSLSDARPGTGAVVVAKSDTAEYRTRPNEAGLYSFWGLPPGTYAVSLEPAPNTNPANPPTLTMRLFAGASCTADLTRAAPRAP